MNNWRPFTALVAILACVIFYGYTKNVAANDPSQPIVSEPARIVEGMMRLERTAPTDKGVAAILYISTKGLRLPMGTLALLGSLICGETESEGYHVLDGVRVMYRPNSAQEVITVDLNHGAANMLTECTSDNDKICYLEMIDASLEVKPENAITWVAIPKGLLRNSAP